MAETAPVYSSYGTKRDPVTLPADLFDGTVNMPVMHQAVKAYLANQRQGNASTKIRKYVTGGNRKPWKQKGTGRARQGSTRAPQWVGGGTVFGPIPRSYAQYVPRQVRALARKSAFNARANENAIVVIDAFAYETPSTKRLAALLGSLSVADKKVLILTDGVKPNVFLSGRNLPMAHVMPYADVSTYHLLWSDVVLIEAPAIGFTLDPLAEAAPHLPRRAKTPARSHPAVVKTTAAAAKPKKKAVAKAVAKAAAKSAAKSAPKSAKGGKTAAKSAKKSGPKSAGGKGSKASATSAAPKGQAKKAPKGPGGAKRQSPKKGGGKRGS